MWWVRFWPAGATIYEPAKERIVEPKWKPPVDDCPRFEWMQTLFLRLFDEPVLRDDQSKIRKSRKRRSLHVLRKYCSMSLRKNRCFIVIFPYSTYSLSIMSHILHPLSALHIVAGSLQSTAWYIRRYLRFFGLVFWYVLYSKENSYRILQSKKYGKSNRFVRVHKPRIYNVMRFQFDSRTMRGKDDDKGSDNEGSFWES